MLETESAQDYGLPANPSEQQMRVWQRQELMLRSYSVTGKRSSSAAAAEVSVPAVEKWLSSDVYGFKKRYELAHGMYVEKLEAEMDATIESKPTNAAILQIFRLKAEHPEKYREEVKVISNEAPAQMWMRLRELGADSRPGEVLEAEVRELDSPDSGA